MTDTLYASGSFDFTGGSFETEYLAYVLGPVAPTDQPVFQFSGTAEVYDLGPVSIFGWGAMDLGGGSARITSEPFGAFEDFAIVPTSQDPLDGFVLADNAGASTGGVGQPWTRFYRVVVPPREARFAVPHIRFGSIAAGTSQYLDGHQLEVVKQGVTAPSDFASARSIRPTVRPARLNYATGSTHVTNLIPGRTYTASADGWAPITFVPTSDTYDLPFTGSPTHILVEEGTTPGEYFDGDSGPDYLWENGGTSGRSYYYPDREQRHYILVRTLQENAPLGVVVEDPIYAVLPSPSSTS